MEHFPKNLIIIWIKNIYNRNAIFHVFLENGDMFRESPVDQFVQFSKSFGFVVIPPAPFCPGDMFERKHGGFLLLQSRSAFRSLPTHLPLFFVTSRKQLKVEDVVTSSSREEKCTLKGTILNAEKALVRVTSS